MISGLSVVGLLSLQATAVLGLALLGLRIGDSLAPDWLLRTARLSLVCGCLLPWLSLTGLGGWVADGLSRSGMEAVSFAETWTVMGLDHAGLSGAEASGGPTSAVTWAVLLLLGLGVVARGLGLIRGRRDVARWRRSARPWHGAPISDLVERLGLRRAPEILVSSTVASPMTFGWLRPTVIVPQELLGLEPGTQRAVLCHELLHIRRRDWPTACLEQLLAAVWWFHPWQGALLRRMSVLRENAVDSAAVRQLGDRASYLQALLTFAQPMAPAFESTSVGSAALAFQQSHLRQRVAKLTEEKKMSKLRRAGTSLGLGAVIAATLLIAGIGLPAVAETHEGAAIYTTDDSRVSHPVRLEGPAPAYPDVERSMKVEGNTVVKVIIGEDGTVRKADVLESMGAAFDEAVLGVLPQWRFAPATLDGKPVQVQYRLTFRFLLDDKDEPEQG